jgi:hypothetical protein
MSKNQITLLILRMVRVRPEKGERIGEGSRRLDERDPVLLPVGFCFLLIPVEEIARHRPSHAVILQASSSGRELAALVRSLDPPGTLVGPSSWAGLWLAIWRRLRRPPAASGSGTCCRRSTPARPPRQEIAEFEAALAAAVEAHERALAERGEGPYGPLA